MSAAAASVGENATRSRAGGERSARQSPSCARVASVYAARTSSACHRNAGEGPARFASGTSNAWSGTRGVSSIGGGGASDDNASGGEKDGLAASPSFSPRRRDSGSSTTGATTLVPSRRSLMSRALARVHHGTCGSTRWLSSPVRAARSNARIVSGLRSANVNASPRLSFRRFAEDNAHRAASRASPRPRALFLCPPVARSPNASSSPPRSLEDDTSSSPEEADERARALGPSAASVPGAYARSNAAIFFFSSSSTTSPRMASPRASPWKDSTQRASCAL